MFAISHFTPRKSRK